MKKSIIIIVSLVIVASIFVVIVQGGGYEGADEFNEIGQNKREAIEFFLKGDAEGQEPVAIVEGEEISKAYFALKVASYRGSKLELDDPKQAAWDSIVTEVCERQYATANGLEYTEQEMEAHMEYLKDAYDSTDESRALIESYASGLGMTVAEYWDYKEKYEAPIELTHYKVSEYIEVNGLEPIDISKAEVEIVDQEFYDGL